MKQRIVIEKRLPFGFKGGWGKLYKRHRYSDNADVVEYQKINYYELGQDVQFKQVDDKSGYNSNANQKRELEEGHILAKTTDAYWNYESKRYECVAEIEDVVKVFGQWWKVVGIKTKSIFTPVEQRFFTCELENINFKEVCHVTK